VSYVWTFRDEARDPAQITPGAIVIAGDEETAAVCQVIDLAPAGDGIIVHLKPHLSASVTRWPTRSGPGSVPLTQVRRDIPVCWSPDYDNSKKCVARSVPRGD
jgi:hypothetical protein